ncbi:hypothetical protein CC86DRAFT_399668 [Ophiobolus disseminans]|uniref:Uncharacterized protein n=1 Tax=Ophiobolus disseminans TaxID=1469910 RepID=A0A6A7AI77_9PLEO|nr:hypothetical protein CC86DRAFT_399668 [Ophiobolus disseminans]
MHSNMMNGFPREMISMAKDLKEMIISQLQAGYGLGGNNSINRFDVYHLKDGDTFVARAIVYLKGSNGSSDFSTWVKLLDGRSEERVVNALENLWNRPRRRTFPP